MAYSYRIKFREILAGFTCASPFVVALVWLHNNFEELISSDGFDRSEVMGVIYAKIMLSIATACAVIVPISSARILDKFGKYNLRNFVVACLSVVVLFCIAAVASLMLYGSRDEVGGDFFVVFVIMAFNFALLSAVTLTPFIIIWHYVAGYEN